MREQTNPNTNQNPHLKKPPDILTYHEYARTTDCSRELPQGEHVVRTRERSGSPSKRSLVVGRTKIQDQAMPGGNGQPHGDSEAPDPSRASQEQDPQTLGLA